MNLNLLTQTTSQYLNLIDWKSITSKMSEYSYFEHTKEKIQGFPKALSSGEILARHKTQETFIQNLEGSHFINFHHCLHFIPSNFNFEENLKRIEKAAILDLKEINAFALLFESFKEIRSLYIKENPETSDKLNDFYHLGMKKLVNPIRRFLSKTGEIDYGAHPELRALNQTIQKYDEEAKKIISTLIQKYDSKLQMNTYDIIHDHYILMFKTAQYEHKFGFIHARSDSGQTLYIEPPELSSLSQKRKQASLEIEKIIYQISMKYSNFLSDNFGSLKLICSYVKHVDYFYALCKYYQDKNFIKPTISSTPHVELKGFFHPLIENPVTNDIHFHNTKGIIISGPNTGGKTVTLKSVCLNLLLASTGHFLPCEQATIYPFQEIYFLSQDHQDLREGLSSFAAESLHHLNLLHQVSTDAVIFIDEIFNTTSSEEASALAIGLFEYLKEHTDPFILVSTHHQMLKIMTHQSQKFSSYNVGFDEETYSPNYKLFSDGPGSSQALNIFETLGKNFSASQKIIEVSKKVLNKKYLDYEALLTEVAKKNSYLTQELEKQKKLSANLENQFQSNQGILKLKMKERLAKLEVEIDKMRAKTHKVLEDVKNGEITTRKLIDKKIFEAKDKVIPKEKITYKAEKVSIPILGEKYVYLPMRKMAKVLKVDMQKKRVSLDLNGKFKIEAKFEDLALGSQTENKKKDNFSFSIKRETSDSLTLDARGMRLDDFKVEVDKSLTSLYSGSIPYLEIIHGHGGGVLKNWLRSFLKDKKDLVIDVPRKSLDGATVIKLS